MEIAEHAQITLKQRGQMVAIPHSQVAIPVLVTPPMKSTFVGGLGMMEQIVGGFGVA